MKEPPGRSGEFKIDKGEFHESIEFKFGV